MSKEILGEFHEVVKEYENMIHHIIHRLGIRDPEKEFYQEGLIALWKAYESYNPDRGKFSSYAYFLIEKAMITLIRKRNRQKEKEDDYKNYLKSDESSFIAQLEMSIDPYLLHQIRQVLNDKQWTWFQLFVLQDLPIKEIAKREHVSEDTVKNWGRFARQKIKPLLQRSYLENW